MTIEQLEKRKQDLLEQQQKLVSNQQQLVANANALSGAIQDCDYWIAQLKSDANAPSPEPTPAQ